LLASERAIRELRQITSWRGNPQKFVVTKGRNTSALPFKTGRHNNGSNSHAHNLATSSKMLTTVASNGQYNMIGDRSTIGMTWQSPKTLQPSGCGFTNITDPIRPRLDSHLSSGWTWLHNVSTFDSLAKGGITVPGQGLTLSLNRLAHRVFCATWLKPNQTEQNRPPCSSRATDQLNSLRRNRK
jgi:hypothetical protein